MPSLASQAGLFTAQDQLDALVYGPSDIAPPQPLVPAGTAAPPTTTVQYPTAETSTTQYGAPEMAVGYGTQVPSSTPEAQPATAPAAQPATAPPSAPQVSSPSAALHSGETYPAAPATAPPTTVGIPSGPLNYAAAEPSLAERTLPMRDTAPFVGGLPRSTPPATAPPASPSAALHRGEPRTRAQLVHQEEAKRQQRNPGAWKPTVDFIPPAASGTLNEVGAGAEDTAEGQIERGRYIAGHIGNALGPFLNEAGYGTQTAGSDFAGRLLGLDPTNPEGLDMANQLTRNLYDWGGDFLKDTLESTVNTGPIDMVLRGGANMLEPPLHLTQNIAPYIGKAIQSIPADVWSATEDVAGPHGMLGQQVASTDVPEGSPWGMRDRFSRQVDQAEQQAEAGNRPGATNSLDATADNIADIRRAWQGVGGTEGLTQDVVTMGLDTARVILANPDSPQPLRLQAQRVLEAANRRTGQEIAEQAGTIPVPQMSLPQLPATAPRGPDPYTQAEQLRVYGNTRGGVSPVPATAPPSAERLSPPTNTPSAADYPAQAYRYQSDRNRGEFAPPPEAPAAAPASRAMPLPPTSPQPPGTVPQPSRPLSTNLRAPAQPGYDPLSSAYVSSEPTQSSWQDRARGAGRSVWNAVPDVNIPTINVPGERSPALQADAFLPALNTARGALDQIGRNSANTTFGLDTGNISAPSLADIAARLPTGSTAGAAPGNTAQPKTKQAGVVGDPWDGQMVGSTEAQPIAVATNADGTTLEIPPIRKVIFANGEVAASEPVPISQQAYDQALARGEEPWLMTAEEAATLVSAGLIEDGVGAALVGQTVMAVPGWVEALRAAEGTAAPTDAASAGGAAPTTIYDSNTRVGTPQPLTQTYPINGSAPQTAAPAAAPSSGGGGGWVDYGSSGGGGRSYGGGGRGYPSTFPSFSGGGDEGYDDPWSNPIFDRFFATAGGQLTGLRGKTSTKRRRGRPTMNRRSRSGKSQSPMPMPPLHGSDDALAAALALRER